MQTELTGRSDELKELQSYFSSGKSEFIAVYGRRRVGKTFLIRAAAKDDFAFFVTGVYNANKNEQLTNFAIALTHYSGSGILDIPENWILAFYRLSLYLESLPEGVKIVFIDELPWMDSAKSGFVSALENFWNSWAALRDDIKLVVCGSATSWIINKLIRNRGGLHNRLTHHLVIEPFRLGECEEYFRTFGFTYTRKQMAECYMATGGIPYYLSLMDKSMSLAQNIDRLFFSKNAALKEEFNDLYRALFKNASPHIAVVTALAAKGKGLTRTEIIKASGLADNGALSLVLEELEQCGFIRRYLPFSTQKSLRKNGVLYQLMDFYTLFYFKFVRNNQYQDEHYWTSSLNSPGYRTWSGLSFEMLCLAHLPQIKNALGISGIQANACSWRSMSGENGAQIDLLIDRKDDTINICEMKYSKGPFEIDKEYCAKLQGKLDTFTAETSTRKSLILTMVTSEGLKHNSYSDIVQKELILDDLFT